MISLPDIHREISLKDVHYDGKPIVYAENPDVKFRVMLKYRPKDGVTAESSS